ncbi:hypothetical protein [Citricoccus nitrophenolicus]
MTTAGVARGNRGRVLDEFAAAFSNACALFVPNVPRATRVR